MTIKPMHDKKYRIVTNGKPAKGQNLDQVLNNLSHIFKTPPEKVRPLLSGKVVTVRKGLDEKTARRMFSVLRKAGLTCKLAQEAEFDLNTRPSISEASTDSGAPDVRAASGARSIDPDMGSTVIEHTAKASSEITPSVAGLDFHKPASRNIPLSSVILLAVYELPSPLGGDIKLMAFVSSSKRPFVLSATSIKYWQFKGISSQSTGVSLRQFIAHVYAHNPSLILDAPTVKFLEGGLPRTLEVDESILASALGRALTAEGLFVEHDSGTAEPGADMSEVLVRIRQAGIRAPEKNETGRMLIALIACGLSIAWGTWNLWGQLSMLRLFDSYFSSGRNPLINHLIMWTSVIVLVLLLTYAGVVLARILSKSTEARDSFRIFAWMIGAFSIMRFILLWGLATGLKRGILGGGFAMTDLTSVLRSKQAVQSALILSPAGIAIPLMILAVRLYSHAPRTRGNQGR